MTDRPAPGSPADWLLYARSDLVAAEIPPPHGLLLETWLFHAQQAAESRQAGEAQALKAVLLHRTGEEPPFTHSLGRLLHALGPHADDVPLSRADAEALSRYAVLARYPADLGEVDEDEWQTSVAQARAVVEWAERIVAEPA